MDSNRSITPTGSLQTGIWQMTMCYAGQIEAALTVEGELVEATGGKLIIIQKKEESVCSLKK